MTSIRSRLSPQDYAAIERSPSVGSIASIDEIEDFTPPNFTMKELLDAIPKHCFKRSATWSSLYLARDFFFIACLGAFALHINTWFGSSGSVLSGNIGVVAQYAAWPTYWWFQSLVGLGVWILAHECGHGAYSASSTVNSLVGWVLHSALLVPYHSWRISHAKHHAANGHVTKDPVYVLPTAKSLGLETPEHGFDSPSVLGQIDDLLEDSPLYVLTYVVAQQLFGWPLYLIMNVASQDYYPRFTNHFNPKSALFDRKHFWQIIWSDIGVALAFAALYFWAQQTSWTTVLMYYGVPYLGVNHWLILITFLQHTDQKLPHYRQGAWTYTRGALCTQDRDVYNFFTHKISSTHVLHHTNAKIPFYYADEATAALKTVLGDYYNYTSEHWAVSLYKTFKNCRFIDDTGLCVFPRNAQGKAVRRAVSDSSDSGVEFDVKAE